MRHILNGEPIFVSPLVTVSEEYPTRKQTRKFKNTRWVKKYKKRYMGKRDAPGMYHMIGIGYVVHPEILDRITEKSLKQAIFLKGVKHDPTINEASI